MGSVRKDIRQTLRQMKASPVFFSVIILTLGIGIGSNTALFSIVKAVLLDPLPYEDSDRILMLHEDNWAPTYIYEDLRETGEELMEVAGSYPREFVLEAGERPFQVEGSEATPNFFRVFPATPSHGRIFVESDADPGAPRTVVLSHHLWQTLFGGATDVLGRTVVIDGNPHQVIGILEREFHQFLPQRTDPEFWIPSHPQVTRPDGSLDWTMPFVRLREGVRPEEAQAALDVVVSRFKEEFPQAEGPRWNLRLVTVKSELVKNVRSGFFMLQLAVGLVLLIACVNVANLLLARVSDRRKEMSVRAALGASKGRLIRQMMTESVVLFVCGGLAGFVLMVLSARLLVAVAPQDTPRLDEVGAEPSVFLFALGVSVLAGLVFGMIPALTTTRQNLAGFLKEGGRARTRSAKQHRISQALVVAEVTLTLVLLVGTGLVVRSFLSLTAQDPGFRTEGVLTVPLNLPQDHFETVPELERYYLRLVQRLQAVPEIESVAVANNLPIERGAANRTYEPATAPGQETELESRQAEYGVVSPEYFRLLGIPLLRGRFFEETDRRSNLDVAIIDEAMRDEVWPGEDPIGERFQFIEEQEDPWVTVIGIVGNIHGEGLGEQPSPGFYIPYQQRPEERGELAVGHAAVLLIEPRAGIENPADAIRAAIADVDPNQPVPEITPLARIVSEGVAPERFRAILLGTFAVIALLLVIAGIYGVIEYLVAERSHEFGIRMAMGANNGDIVKDVLAWGLRLAAVGVVLGLVVVFAVHRYLGSLLFGLAPTDPLNLVGAVAIVLVITLVACFVPARKATHVDPVVALSGQERSVRPSHASAHTAQEQTL